MSIHEYMHVSWHALSKQQTPFILIYAVLQHRYSLSFISSLLYTTTNLYFIRVHSYRTDGMAAYKF
jgi:hypothetical protein